MSKLAFVLALLIGTGLIASHNTVFAASTDAAKKCEDLKDAAKKEACMKAAKGS